MKTAVSILIALIVAIPVYLCAANQGAEKIILDGGASGKVNFAHRQHQNNLGDCKVCHTLFPQEKNAISQMRKKGSLKKREAMNQCVNCHKDLKKQSKPSGPVSCRGCHIK